MRQMVADAVDDKQFLLYYNALLLLKIICLSLYHFCFIPTSCGRDIVAPVETDRVE